MSALTPFLDRLLATGEARLTGRPEPDNIRVSEELLRRAGPKRSLRTRSGR